MRLPDRIACLALVPFDKREAVSLQTAATIADQSSGTIRNWCIEHNIGRKVGGAWLVSRVALQMFLDGDEVALAAYLLGDRESDFVVEYFERFDLRPRRRSTSS